MKASDLDFLCALVRARSGVVIGEERSFFVETRLGPLARRERLGSVTELVALVRQEPAGSLARAAVEAMTVQESSFFRDRDAFGALEAVVLPTLARDKARLKVWSAGCGQGQEAWSLAILAAELEHALPNVDILATDLCTAALEKARAGVYTHFEVQRGLPIRRLLNHFEESDETWRMSAALRDKVRWMRLNLMDTFSVQEGYDLILCRYVVNAFAPDARTSVLAKLEAALAQGGRLMLGKGEAPPPGFSAVPGAPCVFARTSELSVGAAAA